MQAMNTMDLVTKAELAHRYAMRTIEPAHTKRAIELCDDAAVGLVQLNMTTRVKHMLSLADMLRKRLKTLEALASQ